MAISNPQMPNFRRKNHSTIRFQCTCAQTRVGEEVCMVGDVEELGKWDVSKRIRLSTNSKDFPKWISPNLNLTFSDSPIYYKYIITPACTCKNHINLKKCTCLNKNEKIQWESNVSIESQGNRQFNLSHIFNPVVVIDHFGQMNSEIRNLESEPETTINTEIQKDSNYGNNIIYGSHNNRSYTSKEEIQFHKDIDGYLEECATPIRVSSIPSNLNVKSDTKDPSVDSAMYFQMLKNVEWTCKMCSSQVNELKETLDTRLRRLSSTKNAANVDKSLLEEYSSVVTNASVTAFKNVGPEIFESIIQKLLISTPQGDANKYTNNDRISSSLSSNDAFEDVKHELSVIAGSLADLKRENYVFRQLMGYMCSVLDQFVSLGNKSQEDTAKNATSIFHDLNENESLDFDISNTISQPPSQHDSFLDDNNDKVRSDKETNIDENIINCLENENYADNNTNEIDKNDNKKYNNHHISHSMEDLKSASKSKALRRNSMNGFPKIYVSDNSEGMCWIDWTCRSKGLSC